MKYSFIIPTFNRINSLRKCIQSIKNQNFNGDEFEIIIINDGGVKPAIENIILINQVNSGPAKARNNGAKHANGEYLIFIDDDCELDPNWLSEIKNHIENNTLLTGHTINIINSLWSETSQTLLDYLHNKWENTNWHFFASNNILISNENFKQLNGFNENFPLAAAEDREFCLRAKELNIKLKQVITAKVFHSHNLNLVSFSKQHLNYGKGAYYFSQELKIKKLTLKIQPIQFYTQMLLFPFKNHTFTNGIIITSMIIYSQILNFLGFLTIKTNE